MPIANGAVAVDATADYDVVDKVAKTSKLSL
jgi:hypothetical protein